MKLIRTFIMVITAGFILGGLSVSVWAKPSRQNKYASIIVDADSMEILHARKIDGLRYPASLTKMMTLYLTFDALERGEISLREPMLISARAARTPAVKLNLRAGRTIRVEQAIQALAVKSANDAAVVLAEHLGGSEREFAVLMSSKAKALGMQKTVFQNATGLPDVQQVTTARDMAKLAEALLRNHAIYYTYFAQKTFTYKGRTHTNHNSLLGKVEGVDGLKTGYTNASGYNLVLSAKRDGHRLIAVVLGGASGRSRDDHMADLIERGFKVQKQIQVKRRRKFALNADENRAFKKPISATKTARRQTTPQKSDIIQIFTLRAAHNTAYDKLANNKTGRDTGTVRVVQGANGMRIPASPITSGWSVQIGIFDNAAAARNANLFIKSDARLGLVNAEEIIMPMQREHGLIYRARLANLSFDHANQVCKALVKRRQPCLVIAPN